MKKIQFKDLPDMTTPLSSANLNQMQDNMENAIIPIKLVNIDVTTPATATTGDMFYNTTDNKIYTATADNTWDNGSTPRYDGFYINTNDNTLFYYNGSTLIGVGGSGSSATNDSLPISMIMPSASQGSITDWLLCDGSAVSRTEYSELYNAIGTTYGSGDGSTTFNLPNIAGKMIIGYDSDDADFDSLGTTGGSKTHTQTINEMPSHSHPSPKGGNFVEDGGTGTNINTPQGVDFATRTTTTNTGTTGGGQPMDIMNPYIVLNYYIKAHKTAPIYATVKNEETNSETDVYSCNYINNMQVNIITNGSPVKTGRKVDGKDEYVLRRTVDLGTIGSTPNGNNKTYTIPTGLTNEELTREVQGFIKLNNAPGIENILGLNMCRFAGTTLGDTSSFAYYQNGTHSIIFETAGTDRTTYDLTYELYFVYTN